LLRLDPGLPPFQSEVGSGRYPRNSIRDWPSIAGARGVGRPRCRTRRGTAPRGARGFANVPGGWGT